MQLTDIGTIKDLFTRHGFNFSNHLGQNFLTNPSVCPRIAEMGGCTKDVGVLEIGTGIGVLTKELSTRAKKVVAVEIDTTLQPILEETLADCQNVEVIFGDVLKTDLKELFETHFSGMDVVCCANLPYYITSPVLMRLLEEELPLKAITVMVQREAGERIIAPLATRECGAISAAVRFYSEPKKLFSVSRGSFMPAPNVDSMVINLAVRAEHPLLPAEKEVFFKIVRSAFSQRRKQAANPLANDFKLPKEAIRDTLTSVGIKPTARAEELTMDNLFDLSRKLLMKGK